MTPKAYPRGGTPVPDEPGGLPEGSEPEPILADEEDALDDEDRLLLHASLERAAEQFRLGPGIPAQQALRRLRLSGG